MINCSIHNYQEWIGAYMEGNLSREDMLSAELFLQQHPHILDQYLEELEEFSLEPDKAVDPSFPELEMVITPTLHIHPNNFPDYFISYYEGLLTQAEKKELDDFLHLNPRLKSEFILYGSTILVADPSVQFTDKKQLYKKSRPAVPLFGSISAAASVLIMITLIFFWPSDYKNGIALKDSTNVHIPAVEPINNNISPENTSFIKHSLVNNSSNLHNDPDLQKNIHVVKSHDHLKVEMITNTFVPIEHVTPSFEDIQPQTALREIKTNIPVITDETLVAENKPRKKGLFDKLFSGEKTYIEDYVNAGFTAFNHDQEDEKWVLKVDRDKEGKSKRVKFTSPVFSVKSGH